MASIFEATTRYVMPGFRSFAVTAALGELSRSTVVAPAPLPFELEPLLLAWETNRSVGVAGDLLSAAITSGARPPASIEAAEFVLQRADDVSPVLVAVAESMLSRRHDPESAESLPRISSFLDARSQHRIRRRIHDVRRALGRFPGDALHYVELARLYSITGHAEKAKRNMRVALSLAPGNRFVLRSAARTLAHYGDTERAYDLLRRSPATPHDPWLLSAELAVAGLVGDQSRLVKHGTGVVNSGHYSPLSLTELSSGLATVELFKGKRKRSRDLFRTALLQPNENSLAQVEWAFSADRLFDVELNSYNVRRNYEALALEAFGKQQWREVLAQCESWFMDMPFAKRPIMMGSHIATVVLEDYQAARLFCEAGLVAHPGNPQILNNYAYALALEGNVDDALRVLDGISPTSVEAVTTRVCLIATTGLAYYRKGEIQRGRQMYREAMETARGECDPGFHQLAVLNYTREETLANQLIADVLIDEVRRMKVDPRAVTLGILRDKVIALHGRRGDRPASA